MRETAGLNRTELIGQLLQIGHGKLDIYVPICSQAVKEEPELFAHLIAWNDRKGEVRDSKVAFPVIALRGDKDLELYENAAAHLCLLDPRNLVRAVEFHRSLNAVMTYPPPGRYTVKHGAGNMLETAVLKYIRAREANRKWWIKTAVQHKKSLKALYALYHIKPNGLAQDILFDRKKPKGSVWEAIAELKNMSPQEAAGTILNYNIPFLIAVGALGGIKNKPDISLALMEKMSGNELINNTNMLKNMGVFENPVLRSAYDDAVERAKKDKRVSTMKAGKAASVATDKKAAEKMEALQNEKLEQLGGIEGNWLVLGDKSGSMHTAIEMARQLAALIAQQVKGEVNLVFFNTSPTRYDVTGKTLSEIKDMTKRITANGGTSIGCGLDLMREKKEIVNGIAICSDGGDNTAPHFHEAYKKYVATMGVEPTVYHFWVPGENDHMSHYCKMSGIHVQKLDCTKVDAYSVPNLVRSMRASSYQLVDDIMSTPLLTFKEVFKENG